MIPGLGMSMRPPLLDESYVDEVIRVEEADTVRTCHRLARRGFVFGGSTGTVVSGATDWLDRHDARDLTAVAIGPDLGERYLDTIYRASWLRDLYGDDVLSSEGIAADSWTPSPAPPPRWDRELELQNGELESKQHPQLEDRKT
jgi:cysteine synthase A